MTILEAIQQRHSVRSYINKPIDRDTLNELHALVKECNHESGLRIQMVVDEPKAFDSKWAHYGKFSGVSNYFAMIGPKHSRLDETIGYYGERLVLKAQMLGLNTCWVGLTYKKIPDVLHITDGMKLRCVIAFGYGANQGVSHKSKELSNVVKVKGTMPDWFRNGVQAALLAPTAINQQKFKFILHADNRVEAKAGLGFFSKVDLGIVKYHFDIGSGRITC